MILLSLFLFGALGNASCTHWNNIWEVYRYDTVDEAARVLNLPDYQLLEQLNPGMNVRFVSPAQQITVPYISPVPSPATWTTTDCSHILHLRDAVNTISPETDIYKPTSNYNAGTSSRASLITSCPTKSSTTLSTSESILSDSQESSSLALKSHKHDTTSTSHSYHTEKASTAGSHQPDVDSTPKTRQTFITWTTQSTSTETQSNPIQSQPNSPKEQSSSQSQSNSPLTQTTATSPPLPPPTAGASTINKCHDAGYFYTRNETQLAFADQFCQHYKDYELSPKSDKLVDIFQGDKENHFYMYSVEWISNCQPQFDTQNIDHFCSSIMRKNYLACINGGMGGYTDSNCIRYDYRPLSPVTYS